MSTDYSAKTASYKTDLWTVSSMTSQRRAKLGMPRMGEASRVQCITTQRHDMTWRLATTTHPWPHTWQHIAWALSRVWNGSLRKDVWTYYVGCCHRLWSCFYQTYLGKVRTHPMQLLCCAVIYIFCVSQSQVEVLWRIYYTHTYFESPHLHSQSLKAVSRSFQRGHTCMVYIHTSESHSPCRWQSSVTFRPLVGHCWRAVQRTWYHLQAKFSLAHRETPLCRMRKKKRFNWWISMYMA